MSESFICKTGNPRRVCGLRGLPHAGHPPGPRQQGSARAVTVSGQSQAEGQRPSTGPQCTGRWVSVIRGFRTTELRGLCERALALRSLTALPPPWPSSHRTGFPSNPDWTGLLSARFATVPPSLGLVSLARPNLTHR